MSSSRASHDGPATVFVVSRTEPNSGAHSTPDVGCAAGIDELFRLTYFAVRPNASQL